MQHPQSQTVMLILQASYSNAVDTLKLVMGLNKPCESTGLAPLLHAAAYGRVDVMKLIAENGGDLAMTNSLGSVGVT